jgi:WD40 repeat protein
MRLSSATALAVACLLLGCVPKEEGTSTPEPGQAGPAAQPDEPPAGPVSAKYPGVAHSASIDLVSIDPTGVAALTRDTVGGLRIWTALDGSAEPQVVPIANPRSMAILKADEERFVVFAVEASGGARFISMASDGHAKDVATLPPFNPVLQVVALDGTQGGQFVALMKDGSIRTFNLQGEERAAFDKKGFQPNSIRASADGGSVLALTGMDRVGADNRVEAQRFSMGGTAQAPTLRRSGTPQILKTTAVVSDTTVAFSCDGSEVAVLARSSPTHWEIEVYDLGADGEPRNIPVKFNQHQQPHLGYTGAGRLLVSTNEGTPSQLVDTASASIRLRTPIPQDFNHQGRVQASTARRQILGYGTFLFVHDVDDRKHRFLGYATTQGSSVGVSPTGRYVAWAYAQGPVVVESVDASTPAVEIQYGSNNFAGTRVRFLDDDHVIIIDAVGEVTLWHWPSQTVVAHAGTMSNVRNVHIDAAQGVLVLERHTNEAWVYEVSVEDGFVGPYIVGDVFRLGILRPKPPSDALLWSMQSSNNKVREFTLDQLRSDMTTAESEAVAVDLVAGQSPPLAVDPLGQQYGVRWNGTALELFVVQGEQTLGSKPMPTNDISQILPSPRGDRFLAVLNRAGAVSVAMLDSKTLESLWSYATGVFNADAAWSDDGRYVALSANTGAVLLDAETGSPVLSRCGFRFAALGAPPSTAFSAPNQKSLCEL